MAAQSVFDIATTHFDWTVLTVPIYLCAFGCLSILAERFRWTRPAIRKIGYFVVAGAVVSALFVTVRWYRTRSSYLSALESGGFSIVGGVIEDFAPEHYEHRTYESFSISGHSFRYSDTEITPCFNVPFAHGGPIREGASLRIEFSGDCILHIDLLDSGSGRLLEKSAPK
jgi:hypothetical protein